MPPMQLTTLLDSAGVLQMAPFCTVTSGSASAPRSVRDCSCVSCNRTGPSAACPIPQSFKPVENSFVMTSSVRV